MERILKRNLCGLCGNLVPEFLLFSTSDEWNISNKVFPLVVREMEPDRCDKCRRAPYE